MCIRDSIYAANMDEAGFADYTHNAYFQGVRELAEQEGAQVLPICAKLEQDIDVYKRQVWKFNESKIDTDENIGVAN